MKGLSDKRPIGDEFGLRSSKSKLRLVLTIVKRIAIAGLLLGFGGCKQGEGDRCQINSDCQEGLVCCVQRIGTQEVIVGGTCQEEDSCELSDAGVGDAGGDARLTDAGADLMGSDASLASDAIDALNATDASDATDDSQQDSQSDQGMGNDAADAATSGTDAADAANVQDAGDAATDAATDGPDDATSD